MGKTLNIFQINLFFSFIIPKILLLIQKDILSNIIFFNNTNGDIYLKANYDLKRFIFGTMSANGEKRIFYGLDHYLMDLHQYFLTKNGIYVPYLIKNIGNKNKKEIPNAHILLFDKESSYMAMLIGTDNSYIEFIKLYSDINGEEIYRFEQNEVLNPNIFNKGISPSLMYNAGNIYFITNAILENNPLHYITFYQFNFDENDHNIKLTYNETFNNDIKGDYMSCDISISGEPYITCLYLDVDNNYTITFIVDNYYGNYGFSQNKTFKIAGPSNIIDGEYYFLKAITGNLGKNGIYAYYSGDLNTIPTIKIFNIGADFSITNKFDDFPIIFLEGFNFNNGINYNDLCLLEISQKKLDLFFISTDDRREYLIISYIRFYESSQTSKIELIIRYQKLDLKEYNLKIFHGLKAIIFDKVNLYLNIAFDFCLSNENVNINDKKGNAGIVLFSYPKISSSKIDFAEKAFNNNGKFIIVNVTENCIINNNIFGYKITTVVIQKIQENSYDIVDASDYGITFYIDNQVYQIMKFSHEKSLKIDFSDYKFDEAPYDKINIIFSYELEQTDDLYEFNDLWYYIDDTYGNRNDTKTYDKKSKSTSFFNLDIFIDENLITTCNDINCSLCLKNNTDYCIVCKNDNFSIINDKNYGKLKICSKLGIEELINGKYANLSLSSENIQNIYEELKHFLEQEYNGKNILINTTNVKIQISTLENQIISNELSDLNLGECEEILKKKYCKSENDSLILLKFDIKLNEEQSTYVQYNVFEPENKSKIDLNECPNINFIMNIPIEFGSDIESIYEMLSKDGYNLFDENDLFYNDICTTYTNEQGTDVLLSDRRMDFYKKTINVSLCQNGCYFQFYDKETKKARCKCPVENSKIENIELSELKFHKNTMINEFQQILVNSNFRVLKCLKLIFKMKLLAKNIGSIIMTILLLSFISLIFVYKLNNAKNINLFIDAIIKNKSNKQENNTFDKGDSLKVNLNDEKFVKILPLNQKKKKKRKIRKTSKAKTSKISNITNIIINMNQNPNNNPPKKRRKSLIVENIRNSNRNMLNSNNIDESTNPSIYIPYRIKHKTTHFKKFCDKKSIDKNSNEDIEVYNKIGNNEIKTHPNDDIQKNDVNKIEKLKNESYTNIKLKIKEKKDLNQVIKIEELKPVITNLNDEEMNSLEYEEAIKLDKRTYFQYYLSLIKKKQLIIFTFFIFNDYNLLSIKISLFILSFSLYLTINCFFFNDKSMHKIYENKGSFNIIHQIPQIFYSSIISTIINMLLKTLSLSEKSLLKIKQEKDVDISIKKAKNVEKCIKIKFLIFFIISLLLMLFFWYFISCFCAVYKNTQIILFKDTIISFALSMLYPFGINIIPGLFRMPALRAEQKDKKNLYFFSQIVALF